MAVNSAVSMSSLAFPEVGVKVVVIGLLALSWVSPLRRVVLKLVSAVFTWVWVIEANGAGLELNPANHVLGVAVPTRLATSRSVSGVTFTVPAEMAIEL
jgi:hypothetical protein